MSDKKPIDARIAHWLVYPLRNTPVTPNHLTTLRLLFGIAACVLFAQGTFWLINLGAICFIISNFLDHTDGELARALRHSVGNPPARGRQRFHPAVHSRWT